MLEMFFDDEKVFSVIEKILQSESNEVDVGRICFDLGLSPDKAALIVHKLVFLDILQETDSVKSFTLNLESDILLGLCIFDTIVGKFCEDKSKELSENVVTIDVDEFPFEEIDEFLEKIMSEKLFRGNL